MHRRRLWRERLGGAAGPILAGTILVGDGEQPGGRRPGRRATLAGTAVSKVAGTVTQVDMRVTYNPTYSLLSGP